MLEAINLSKNYNGTVALDGLNLKIEQGEIFCLLGANGAGKTTTINLFLNFIAPTSGSASINGFDVVAHPLETKRFIAYIPEQVNLYRNLTGLENLEYLGISPRWRILRSTHERNSSISSPRQVFLPKPRRSAFLRIRRGCARKSASLSPSQKGPKHCCSTSRLRVWTRKRLMSSLSYSFG
jgi:ABC-type enterochelin transport system ATPase subunit